MLETEPKVVCVSVEKPSITKLYSQPRPPKKTIFLKKLNRLRLEIYVGSHMDIWTFLSFTLC